MGGGANYDAEDPSAGMQTFARLEGDRLIVNSEKHYTTNGTGWDGNGAHLYTVVCRTDPQKGAVIPGTGGFRKVRWPDPRRGKGKRT